MVGSISSVPIADPDLPIGLRPALDFSPRRGSIFDDPGDERSSHFSQRAKGLGEYYAGREPSWYAKAVAPLAGAERVLDLGCGPGLALRALLDQGSASVLGIDRWPAFVAGAPPETPIVAHDMTLPMPFLESGSFDGVLSHYALDYVSPICIRQVLREAHRVLAPGGRLALYVAAIGLGGGDEGRTVPYATSAVRVLLAEAGFEDAEVVASSNGRNTVATARRGPGAAPPPPEPRARVEGATQLTASFRGGGETLGLELVGEGRAAAFSVDLPSPGEGDGSSIAACLRAQPRVGRGTELQLWVWRGRVPVVAERALLELDVEEMRIASGGGEAGHVDIWRPGERCLEPRGSAHARVAELPPGGEMSDAERGAEGRRVVVESAADAPVEWDRIGPGHNRFLIRLGAGSDLDAIDREWLAGRLHGVAVAADELAGAELRELLLWAGWRQSLLYLGGDDWAAILAAAERRREELAGPVVLVDPALSRDLPARPPGPGVAAFVAANDDFFALLDAAALARTPAVDLALLAGGLLLAGAGEARGSVAEDANETLRHLTERTLLMRLRQASGRSPAEVGRREA